jgi:hypothetical protein
MLPEPNRNGRRVHQRQAGRARGSKADRYLALTPGMSDTRGLEQRLRPASKLANL